MDSPLEPILGDEMRELNRTLLSSELTPEEKEREVERVANVLVRKRQEMEELERNSAKLVGHEDYFNEQLNRVRDLKRYVTAEQLELFLRDFIEKQFPRCRLDRNEEQGILDLRVSDDLIAAVRSVLAADDPALSAFLSRCYEGGVLRVTFRQDVAHNKREVEFITPTHPLVRAVSEHLRREKEQIHPVAKVILKTNLVAPGDYCYEIFAVKTPPHAGGLRLETVVVSLDRRQTLSGEVTERLL